MKFSIITPSFNQGRYIEQNIESVLKQNCKDFEHIIIDGGSTDNTIEILKKYPHLIWISEKDNGQADALNKGLRLAMGDIVGWINSDDYYEKDIFNIVAKEFKDDKVEWIIGNMVKIFDCDHTHLKLKSPEITYEKLLADPDIVRQQPTFFRRKFLEKVHGWDSSFYMIMDYDLWIRLVRHSKPKMINKIFAYYTIHENQKSDLKNSMLQLSEISQIFMREKANLWIWIKFLFKRTRYILKGVVKYILIKLKIIDNKYITKPFIRRNNN